MPPEYSGNGADIVDPHDPFPQSEPNGSHLTRFCSSSFLASSEKQSPLIGYRPAHRCTSLFFHAQTTES